MSKVLQKLQTDEKALEIIARANRRSHRWGSGDARDFALFVVDETRKSNQAQRSNKLTRGLRKFIKEMEDEDHGELGGSARSYVRRELLKILEMK